MKKLAYLICLVVLGCGRPDAPEASSSPQWPTATEPAAIATAPNVPPPIAREGNRIVQLQLETIEVEGTLAEGVRSDTRYRFWTFNGTVPGPFVRVRQGDILEVKLVNPATSHMPHNVDFHAATGTGGGAELTTTPPGFTRTVRLAMLQPGLFIYHCAVPPVPDHIANGMYGLILVEPPEGMPPVDREFYVLQSEFYTKEPFGHEGLTTYDPKKGSLEQPTYVVFNGRVGSLLGDDSLRAKVGERVRIYFGVGGPNLTSSFHVIGEIFDKVQPEGSTASLLENVQTTTVPAGGSAIVEFKLDTAGVYTLVDHAIFRTAKGCLGQLRVEGTGDPNIISPVGTMQPISGKPPVGQAHPTTAPGH